MTRPHRRTGDGLRIALLSPTYWPEVRRGTERLLHDLADGLLARGHRPTLITSHPRLPRRTMENGLEVLRVWRPPEDRLRRRGHQPGLTHLPLSYLALRAGDYDVAHAVYPTDALVAGRWSGHTGRPAVASMMGLPTRASVAGVRGRVATVRRAARECTVVSLSDTAARAFEEVLGVDSRVIGAGVNLERFRPGGGRDPRPTVLCPAALGEPRKRVGELITAFEALRATRPDARLILSRPRSGAAPSEERQAAQTPGVELVDLDRDEDLVAAYRRAWLTALPAVEEAFGLVLVESLACGTPCVGRADGAAAEIIDSERIGRRFRGDRPDELFQALDQALELAANPATVGVCRARAGDHSLQHCVDAYEALYRELLGAG